MSDHECSADKANISGNCPDCGKSELQMRLCRIELQEEGTFPVECANCTFTKADIGTVFITSVEDVGGNAV